MFLDVTVTHQHSDKRWVPQSRSLKIFFAGLPPRTPPKWGLSLRQPTPDPSFIASHRATLLWPILTGQHFCVLFSQGWTNVSHSHRATLLCPILTLDGKNSTEPQKSTQKHVFWGLTKNTEKHFCHLGSEADPKTLKNTCFGVWPKTLKNIFTI